MSSITKVGIFNEIKRNKQLFLSLFSSFNIFFDIIFFNPKFFSNSLFYFPKLLNNSEDHFLLFIQYSSDSE